MGILKNTLWRVLSGIINGLGLKTCVNIIPYISVGVSWPKAKMSQK
jgi:hypothetical protein